LLDINNFSSTFVSAHLRVRLTCLKTLGMRRGFIKSTFLADSHSVLFVVNVVIYVIVVVIVLALHNRVKADALTLSQVS
jgi:hypothetical protein